jgi:hypothetical protein
MSHRIEGKMPEPLMTWASWQASYYRLLNRERNAEAYRCLSDQNPDLPYSQCEVLLRCRSSGNRDPFLCLRLWKMSDQATTKLIGLSISGVFIAMLLLNAVS